MGGNDEFQFRMSDEAREHVIATVAEIIEQFGFSRPEAVGRVNRHWARQEFVEQDVVDALTHEVPQDWARFIVYEPGVKWWLPEVELRIRPYP